MDVDARIEGLQAENERLRFRIAQLEADGGLGFVAPLEWGLTSHQARQFGMLMARDVASKDQLMAAVYFDPSREEPQVKIIDVFVCHVRRKLRPFGLTIETLWGAGYYLTPSTKAAVRARLEQGMAA